MDTRLSLILRSISFDLMDVEDSDFKKEDVDFSDFSLVWLAHVCTFNEFASQEQAMSVEERDEYRKLKDRFQAQKAKILLLGLEYPDIE